MTSHDHEQLFDEIRISLDRGESRIYLINSDGINGTERKKNYSLISTFKVSGHAGRFDVITLTLNIGSLIGILGLATFICDIVALYVHRQSDVYRQQKFQDVDLNLLRLETLNTLPLSMMSEESKRKHANHIEQAILTGHVIDNTDETSTCEEFDKRKSSRTKTNHHHDCYDDVSTASKDTNHQSTPMLIYGNYHQQRLGLANNSLNESPMISVKQRRSQSGNTNIRPNQLSLLTDEKNQFYDKSNIVFVDEDSPDLSERPIPLIEERITPNSTVLTNTHAIHRIAPKLETFL